MGFPIKTKKIHDGISHETSSNIIQFDLVCIFPSSISHWDFPSKPAFPHHPISLNYREILKLIHMFRHRLGTIIPSDIQQKQKNHRFQKKHHPISPSNVRRIRPLRPRRIEVLNFSMWAGRTAPSALAEVELSLQWSPSDLGKNLAKTVGKTVGIPKFS